MGSLSGTFVSRTSVRRLAGIGDDGRGAYSSSRDWVEHGLGSLAKVLGASIPEVGEPT